MRVISINLFLFTSLLSMAQVTRNLSDFPELVMTEIPGAVALSKPVLITGTESPVITEGYGFAAPAFYDMNEDGLKDLLIGEFASGLIKGFAAGNYVRVYLNEGTAEKPEYSGKFTYASPPAVYKSLGMGVPYSVYQGCCIGFTPQFIDLNQDGFMDMITGTYYGDVVWFEGTEKGILPGKLLPQEGNPSENLDNKQPFPSTYWLFSSASLGDITGDGLPDMVFGGNSLRISKNIGSKEEPRFSTRELLLDVDRLPLKIYDFKISEWKHDKTLRSESMAKSAAGGYKLSPHVVDWDNDGELDLLVTSAYSYEGLSVIDFFKGMPAEAKAKAGIASDEPRFYPPIALFKSKDGSKTFPGSQPIVFVTDYNDDGINDLLIGVTIGTVNGKYNDRLNWTWELENNVHGTGKDMGYYSGSMSELVMNHEREQAVKDKLLKNISFEEWLTVKRIGYVYVMLGSKPASPSPPERDGVRPKTKSSTGKHKSKK